MGKRGLGCRGLGFRVWVIVVLVQVLGAYMIVEHLDSQGLNDSLTQAPILVQVPKVSRKGPKSVATTAWPMHLWHGGSQEEVVPSSRHVLNMASCFACMNPSKQARRLR